MRVQRFVLELVEEIHVQAGVIILRYGELEKKFEGIWDDEVGLDKLPVAVPEAVKTVNEIFREARLTCRKYTLPARQSCFSSLATYLLLAATRSKRIPLSQSWSRHEDWQAYLMSLIEYTVEGLLLHYQRGLSAAAIEILELTRDRGDIPCRLNVAQESRLVWGELMYRPGYMAVVSKQLKMLDHLAPVVVITDLVRALLTKSDGLPKSVAEFEEMAAEIRSVRKKEHQELPN